MQIATQTDIQDLTSWRNTVDRLAFQLIRQAALHICERLTAYLLLPHQLIQLNAEAIAAGQLDINDEIASEKYFWRQARLFKHLSYIGFALIDGSRESGSGRWINGELIAVYQSINGKGFDYAVDEQGNRTHLIQSYNYAPFEQPHHQQALNANQPIWTDIFTDVIEHVNVTEQGRLIEGQNDFSNVGYRNYVSMNAERPLYNPHGEVIGLSIIDVLLISISGFLKELNVSPDGIIFIVERNGLLVGSSDQQSILHRVNDRAERFNALTTPNLMMRTIAEELQQRSGGFQSIQQAQQFDFSINQQRQFVYVTPWQDSYGLDWLVVVSVPDEDLRV